MTEKTEPLEAADVSEMPELRRLAEQVRTTGRPTSLRVAGEEVGVLIPPRPEPKTTRKRRTRYLHPDDTFWNIVGMYSEPGDTTDVSRNKYKYLAEAYKPRKE